MTVSFGRVLEIRKFVMVSTQRPRSVTRKKNSVTKLPRMRTADIHTAPGHLVRRAQQISNAIFAEEFRDHDITSAQYAALIAIRDRPGMEQRTLVEVVAIDRSTIGSLLKTLEEKKLIRRVVPEHDQRAKQIFATRAGEDFLDATRQAIFRVQERLLAPLPEEERIYFMKCFTRLVHLNNNISRAPLRAQKD